MVRRVVVGTEGNEEDEETNVDVEDSLSLLDEDLDDRTVDVKVVTVLSSMPIDGSIEEVDT